MKKEEIKRFLERMSLSQGLYGRILRDINNAENPDEIWDKLESQNFKDDLDIIFFFEC